MRTAVSGDAYRVIATHILPGLVGVSTWTIALYDRSPGFRNYVQQHPPEATGSIILAGIFWGFICEDVGSRLENLWYALLPDGDKQTSNEAWSSYLRTAYKTEPIGHKYLRSLVTRLKFELNAAVGLATAAVGILFTHVSFIHPDWIACAMALTATSLAFEAKATVRLLNNVRTELQKQIRLIG
jgi:hypothetical protein